MSSTDERKSDKGRGSRGSRGRGRGRGGRGRGRERGGKNKKEGSKVHVPDRQQQHSKQEASSTTNTNKWLEDSLANLGHFGPPLVLQAFEVCNDDSRQQNIADEQFIRLALWLEDRLIRAW